MTLVPEIRICSVRRRPIRPTGRFVLYWMIANRRRHWNYALQRAVWWAQELKKPLLVLEALRCDYPWANDRIHAFVMQGMAQNALDFESAPVTYYPYVEPEPGAGKGLLESLFQGCAVVVTDTYPCFFLPRMVEAAANRCPVLMESVDSCGIVPLALPPKAFSAAHLFRRWFQKNHDRCLSDMPLVDPLKDANLPQPVPIPDDVFRRWPSAANHRLSMQDDWLRSLPIDHRVGPVETVGGARGARERLVSFLKRIDSYATDRNHPDEDGTSGLSPYLHFGHISSHEIFYRMMDREGWTMDRLQEKAHGRAKGWWGMSEGAEAFIDQWLIWREVGFQFCYHEPRYEQWETLPAWARATLEDHAGDKRPYLYDLNVFESARTHDPVWNACQRQLLQEGRMHNYLRMLWGKNILHWSRSPREALAVMIELNNRYALDGRDPNSYSGIGWVLGRFDRAWGPERPVFGKIRYMNSASAMRKLRMEGYLHRFGGSLSSTESNGGS
uniref:Deoxyribodipyrimidine photo-lyase n=1 Tax=Desulfatirhabdium butyrativorans TaxID=340467 RepID=A0A7C4MTM9_9BACT